MRKQKWLLPLCILAVATVVIGTAFFRGIHSADGDWMGLGRREVLSLADGWEMADGTAAEPLPTALTLSADGSATVSRALPTELAEGRELYIQTNYQPVEAWLDGQALAVRGISADLRARTHSELPWVSLTLPEDCAGGRLTLRLAGTGSKPQTELFRVLLGRESDVELVLFRDALMPMLLCMLMLLLAFTLFCFALGEWRRYKDYNFGGVLLITLFVECACVWFFTDSTIQGMAFLGNDTFFLFNVFGYLLFPLPFVLYMRGCLKRGRRVLDTLSVALCAHAVIEGLLLLFGGFDTARAVSTSHMLLAAGVAAMCVFTWRDQRARREKRPTELLIGLLILAVSGLRAMYSYYFLHNPDNSSFFRYGTFVYLVMLAVNALRTDVGFVFKARS
ncbi:MAG: hypothetical protein PHY12_15965, partial [Eubacteriales bacterium]|nr:hypothetical protein [Eubacteriales bacterium]